jgi:hypothetical protein
VPDRWRRSALVAGAVWAALWTPPIVGAITGTPGNLTRLARYFVSAEEPRVGFVRAVGIVASEFRFVPPWLGGPHRVEYITSNALPSSAWWLLVPALLVAAGSAAARASGNREDARLVGLAAVMLAVSIVAISRADEPRAYTFEWRLIPAAFVVVASLWSIAAALAPRAPRWSERVATVAVLGVIAWGCIVRGASAASPGTNTSLEVRERALGDVMEQLRRGGRHDGGPILVRPFGTEPPHLFDGLVNALDREGVDVRVDARLARIFGDHRVAAPLAAREVWYVLEQGSLEPALLSMPGSRAIARTTPLDPAEDAELSRMQLRLADQLESAGRADLALVVDSPYIAVVSAGIAQVDELLARRVAAANARIERGGDCRCSVVALSGPARLQGPPALRTPS